jgi:hypothetical protein
LIEEIRPGSLLFLVDYRKKKVEVLRLIQDAIEFHLEGIRLHHHRIPARRTMATEVLVPA